MKVDQIALRALSSSSNSDSSGLLGDEPRYWPPELRSSSDVLSTRRLVWAVAGSRSRWQRADGPLTDTATVAELAPRLSCCSLRNSVAAVATDSSSQVPDRPWLCTTFSSSNDISSEMATPSRRCALRIPWKPIQVREKVLKKNRATRVHSKKCKLMQRHSLMKDVSLRYERTHQDFFPLNMYYDNWSEFQESIQSTLSVLSFTKSSESLVSGR